MVSPSEYSAEDLTKRIYVNCRNCGNTFPSGFRVLSPTQLIGFRFLCLNCHAIVRCSPPEYLEKIEGKFKQAMKREEFFAGPHSARIEMKGPDLYHLTSEVVANKDAVLTCDKAIVAYEGQT